MEYIYKNGWRILTSKKPQKMRLSELGKIVLMKIIQKELITVYSS